MTRRLTRPLGVWEFGTRADSDIVDIPGSMANHVKLPDTLDFITKVFFSNHPVRDGVFDVVVLEVQAR